MPKTDRQVMKDIMYEATDILDQRLTNIRDSIYAASTQIIEFGDYKTPLKEATKKSRELADVIEQYAKALAQYENK